MFRRTVLAVGLSVAVAGPFASPAAAQGELVVYCGVQEEWCRPMMAAFERATGVRVAMTRRATGETLAQIRAERQNPRGDVWWGGTGDPHLQAAEEGLTEEYRSTNLALLHPWAVRQAEQSGFRTVGIYAGILGYSFNTRELERRRVAAPRCWADLAKPEFRGEVQVADPNTSGTAYTMLATFVQLMGEEQAFTFLRALHRNINQYTRSGAAPARAVATGESLVGITFLQDAVTQKVNGAPVALVAPCEGTGYEIGSMSIIKGARNMENAKRFYDWALTAQAQALAAEAKSYQLPSNREAPVPPEAPRFEDVKLIDYDFAKYGSAAERTRILQRWDREVRSGQR
ncbi:MAG: ABC transporter substrate-binding protein [Acetobacteraceae bacterium]|jgi:iron(III) transport system substrate-binding protein|nr:ABC transporter substrate-binding protein [Acetobacteraceae bacterium]